MLYFYPLFSGIRIQASSNALTDPKPQKSELRSSRPSALHVKDATHALKSTDLLPRFIDALLLSLSVLTGRHHGVSGPLSAFVRRRASEAVHSAPHSIIRSRSDGCRGGEGSAL